MRTRSYLLVLYEEELSVILESTVLLSENGLSKAHVWQLS